MTDHSGWQDADSFTPTDPPTPKRVHSVDSGRVDPHLTRYVGVEAAKEIRELFEEIVSLSIEWHRASPYGECEPKVDEPPIVNYWREKVNDILGIGND